MNPAPTDPVACAATGCDQPVTRSGRPGRPPTYCTPACRPSRRTGDSDLPVVEVDHEPIPANSRPTGRIWQVQLRRSNDTVVIATELGRPSADHLAKQIHELLNPRPEPHRAAID